MDTERMLIKCGRPFISFSIGRRDQFFHLFRGLAGILRHDLYENILYIGEGLYRQTLERKDADAGQQSRRDEDQQALLQAERDYFISHGALSPV